MKKMLLYVSVALFAVWAPVASGEDFRAASWGMSEKEVVALEKSNAVDQKTMPDGSNWLVVQDNVLGLPVTVSYMFVDDKLVQGTTAFFKLSLDGSTNNAQANLSRILAALKEKYGDAISVTPSPIGVSKTQWQNKSTDIFLNEGMRGDTPYAMVLYYSRKLVDLRMKTRAREIERKL